MVHTVIIHGFALLPKFSLLHLKNQMAARCKYIAYNNYYGYIIHMNSAILHSMYSDDSVLSVSYRLPERTETRGEGGFCPVIMYYCTEQQVSNESMSGWPKLTVYRKPMPSWLSNHNLYVCKIGVQIMHIVCA